MIKILQIGMDSCLGGIEIFVKNVFNNIDTSKYHFDFICSSDEKMCFEEDFKSNGCKVYYVTSRKKNIFKNVQEIKRIIKNGKYDIIHWNAMSLSNNIAAMIGIKLGISVIVHTHSVWKSSSLKSSILHRFNKFILPKNKVVKLACSIDAGKKLFKKKFKVLDNGIDLNNFKYNRKKREKIRKELNVDDDIIIVGHVGRLNYAKNHSYLLDIFKEYHNMNSNSILVLIGSGSLEGELKEKSKQLKIDSSVRFLGNRKNTDEFLSAFDLFVFPSKFEGLPIALVEAQVSGLNCIISDTITKEVKVSNRVKLLSLSFEPSKWALEMLNCNINDRSFNTNSNNVKKYDIVNTTKELEKIYDEIMDKGCIVYD